MRLRIVHDEHGRIVAAAPVPEANDDSVAAVPVAGPRQTEAEVNVPDDMADQDLDVICTRLQMDTERQLLIPVTDGG